MSSSIQFAQPLWFAALLSLPLLLFMKRKGGSEASVGFSSLRLLLALGVQPRRQRGRLSFFLLLAAMVAGIFALARPQKLRSVNYSTASGIDILLAIDVSGSMETEDMSYQGSRAKRLTVARELAIAFIQQRRNDRIGLVTFAAYPLDKSPITLQHEWLADLLAGINAEEIDESGTAIGSAIAAAATRLVDRPDSKSKIIILVTDGSNTAGKLSPLDAAKLASRLGIRIYTVAVGTEEGRLTGTDTPRPQEFDPATLKQIAASTEGEYFRARDTASFATAFSSINELEKTEATRKTLHTREELFQYPLALAIVLGLVAMLLPLWRPEPAPQS